MLPIMRVVVVMMVAGWSTRGMRTRMTNDETRDLMLTNCFTDRTANRTIEIFTTVVVEEDIAGGDTQGILHDGSRQDSVVRKKPSLTMDRAKRHNQHGQGAHLATLLFAFGNMLP